MGLTSLELEATRRGVIVPSAATLRRYGLVADEWIGLLKAQGWRCPICDRWQGIRFVTDHEHVPGWKSKPPEERKLYVRGVLCAYCNHRRVHSKLGAPMAFRIADYFAAYESRRAA